ncbi:hypothetical protein [Methylorubrum podarium]|jgi:hypothetical protein|uniref:hypothetical protein n=1 Tax=Methylorubrum podarium TaxID=200476 RepID=UPI001EE1CA36|nr:hypothetical protein [Methylorubrum podarium]
MTMLPSFRAVITRLNADKLQATPHVVPQPGLLRSVMGDDAFLAALDERRRWIAANCEGSFQFADLRDSKGKLKGMLYKFADRNEAFSFRMYF